MNQQSSTDATIFPALKEGRRQFLALVQDIRPLLHRYCTRMTGSVTQGEDIVQDTLAHAYYELSELKALPAMRAWLFRIAHNRALAVAPQPAATQPPRSVSPALARYAALFGARDWDGVRAMLTEDVRLDLVSVSQRAGREQVGTYFANYDAVHDWHLVPAWLQAREVIAVFRNPGDATPGYVIELGLVGDRVAKIRDFRYVPYIVRDAVIEWAT